ncbi:MAG: hypothetical protein ACXWN0_00970, partial [Isosphaeraceae bacterium]
MGPCPQTARSRTGRASGSAPGRSSAREALWEREARTPPTPCPRDRIVRPARPPGRSAVPGPAIAAELLRGRPAPGAGGHGRRTIVIPGGDPPGGAGRDDAAPTEVGLGVRRRGRRTRSKSK